MMDEGLLEEVRNVYQKYGKTKALNTGIGYKELIDYLDGNTALEDAISLIKQRSRKYAKRQYTWFNHQLPTVWFNTDYENFDNTVLEVINYIDSQK
jgi:tRNA dimethylallyltransferase